MWLVRCLFLVAVGLVTAVMVSPAQQAAKTPRPMGKNAARAFTPGQVLLKALREPIETKDFAAPNISLKDFLHLLDAKLEKQGKSVPILVAFEAFKDECPDCYKEEADLYDTKVRLPDLPRQLTLAAALRIVLGQIPTNNATFIVRRGAIEITTVTQAAPWSLVAQKVDAVFDKRPLADAVQDLSELTGASVSLDPRIGDKRDAPVTATFANDVSVKTALSQLADMAGVRVLFVEEGLYVTTAENAEALRKERKAQEREQLWRKRNDLPNPGELPRLQRKEAAGAGA
jgi:hypothetical protein